MGPGDFATLALRRHVKRSLIAIVFTLASFSHARSLVESSVHAIFNANTSQNCPGTEDHFRQRADSEYETLITNTPSKIVPNAVIASEPMIFKEVKPGVRITDRPTLIQVIEKTFSGVSLAAQTAALSACNDAVCILKTILGSEEAAKRLITISLKTGFTVSISPSRTILLQEKVTLNGVESIRTRQSSSIWSLNELRRFSFTAEIFPQLRMKISDPTTLYRAGYRSKAAAEASSEGWINFYEGAFQNDETPWDGAENAILTDKVFVHEFCHLIDYEARNETQNSNLIKRYRSLLAKYQPRSGLGWGVRGANERFVTDYAKTSHAEDFADSCAYFILAPKTLEERAPEKYAALKDLVFGRDFKTASWNRPLFPEVSDLFSSQSTEDRCESDILKRAEDLRFLGNGRVNEVVERTTTSISSMQHSHWWITSGILKKSRENILQEAVTRLESSQTFCDRGGENALRLRAGSVCKNTQKKLENLTKRDPEEMKNLATQCVKNEKNLTSQCLDAKIIAKIQTETSDPFITTLARRYETETIPMSIQKEVIGNFSALDWLGACLKPIVSVALDPSGGFSYQLQGPINLYGSGKLILPSSENPVALGSVQNACMLEIKDMMRAQNYVLPPWSASQGVEFYKALPDFEKYIEGFEKVIFNGALRKTCGPTGQAACTEEDVMKRYRGWETVYRPGTDSQPRTAGPAPELVRITKNLN